jgi:CheY-like chemotaxis protein
LENGEQLIHFLEKADRAQLPHLILLDINMPKMNGLQALDIIHSRTDLPPVPVLIYSTSNCQELKTKCLSLGAIGFVTKFFSIVDMTAFAAGINDFLNNKSALPGSNVMIKAGINP